MCVLQRQRLVQAANGVETAVVVDSKPDIENGNVPEDKSTEDKESELTSPFKLPGEEHTHNIKKDEKIKHLAVEMLL